MKQRIIFYKKIRHSEINNANYFLPSKEDIILLKPPSSSSSSCRPGSFSRGTGETESLRGGIMNELIIVIKSPPSSSSLSSSSMS